MNKRANARVGMLPESYGVMLRWRRDGNTLLLNLMDPLTGAPLTRERRIADPKALLDMVERTLEPPRSSPRAVTFHEAVAAGRGELRVELGADQFSRLRQS